ncbi:Acetophenone carboxylase gamma subunit [Micromonospora sp. MW-13]|uniref:hydantoinase/oxoprolinase family protein n=1 Tax=Micromonospora sp. MW-13 TaxID=2094022 RepID=UPI000E43D782|nr:hydantoinase/oxoprolinase family protein [Micromonospora sp. MW-13]RGC66814.1 Acetophenone carboxylase gamma subunit [Micromonospora sp. MW-13]
MYRLGIDTGGTHTDLVLLDEKSGRTWVEKVPSTPRRIVDAVLSGAARILDKAAIEPKDVHTIVYGTTVAVNMILQGERISAGLITTAGFGDVLEVRNSYRYGNIYDVQWEPSPPIIERRHCFEVRQRHDFRGQEVEPLDEEQVRQTARAIRDLGLESVAICLLHGYTQPGHEVRVAQILAEELPGLPVSLSSVVSPRISEYERASTTALDAYVKPKLSAHFVDFAEQAEKAGFGATLLTMQGSGGTFSLRRAAERPIRVANSGPVAGAIAGAYFAAEVDCANVITYDMGGTSTDLAVVIDGAPTVVPRDELLGHPIQLSSIEITPIGSGGGSIVWIDEGGALRVGPDSAGASPGPVCYGAGGTRPTLTDAAVVTGRLNPDYFLGGRQRLDREAARDALALSRDDTDDWDPERWAAGAIAIAAADSVRAIRRVSIARGLDPRDFAIVGFGGAGGLIVSDAARELGIPTVVIPPNPGNVSAMGLLLADQSCDAVASRLCPLDEVDVGTVTEWFDQLEAEAAKELLSEGIAMDRITVRRTAELRYRGQSFELVVPFEKGYGDGALEHLASSFHQLHEQRYGHASPNDPVQLVSLRVSAVATTAKPSFPRLPRAAGAGADAAVKERRPVMFDRKIDTPVYDRALLRPGHVIEGPAIVEEPGSTTVLWPDQRLSVSPIGTLVLTAR